MKRFVECNLTYTGFESKSVKYAQMSYGRSPKTRTKSWVSAVIVQAAYDFVQSATRSVADAEHDSRRAFVADGSGVSIERRLT